MTVSKKFAEFIIDFNCKRLDDEVIHAFKRALLDYMCVTIVGSQTNTSKIVQSYMAATDNSAHCCIIGTNIRLSPINAAFVNGVSCHATDFDDGYTRGSVHPAGSCISSCLAVAEMLKVPPTDFMKAVIVAYEIVLRIASYVHPFAAKKGFHNTATVGVFGATVGASSLLDLDIEQIMNALGAAGSFAGGLREFLSIGNNGGEIKRIHPGKAARDGILCAELASRGITAPHTIFEGQYGFLKAFGCMTSDIDKLFKDMGKEFLITECYFKPYPICRHLHGTVEAIKEIKRESNINPKSIDRITIETYQIGVQGHDYRQCDSLLAAQMNHQCVAALQLHYEEVTLENLKNGFTQDVKDMINKINVFVSDKCEQLYPQNRPTIVTIIKKSGEKLQKKIMNPKGETNNPLTDDQITSKFYINCEKIIGKNKCNQIVNTIWGFETLKSMNEFYRW